MEYNKEIINSDAGEAKRQLFGKFENVTCVKSDTCEMIVSINNSNRRKRAMGSSASVQFTIPMSNRSDLDAAAYITNGTGRNIISKLVTCFLS